MTNCKHDGNRKMSDWIRDPEPLWPGMKYRHVMCDQCGDDLPDEYQ